MIIYTHISFKNILYNKTKKGDIDYLLINIYAHMFTEQELAQARAILKANKQENLLRFIDKLDNNKKEKIIKQILNLDFTQLNKLYEETKSSAEIINKKIENIKYVDEYKLSDEAKERYTNIGGKIIKNNQYAVVTMAGGQGTRLEHNGPKGTFKVDVNPEPKYLFQILAENLQRANKKYNVILPWYIMTSTENNEETVNFFEKHEYFGYPKENVMFFTQGNLPILLENGDLIVDKDYTIKEAADGNGCIYSAMAKAGVLEDMKKKNVKWIFIGAVDNILLNMVDPILLGLTIDEKNEAASKSVAKASPKEKVGAFYQINGVPSVIKYTELPEKMAEEVDENGELKYGESHIMCNLYTIDAIEKISKETLMYHSAFKKNSYIDEEGKEVIPEEPNSYKFESFIFDAFEFFDDIAILRGKREDDFAPVKNKDGVDSPRTAKELYEKFWNRNRD